MTKVDSKQNEIVTALKSDNSHLKEDKTTADKAYKKLQITLEQLLAKHEKLVKEHKSLSNKARSKLSKVSKELARYKKLAEEKSVASETGVMIDEWISTPAILIIILGILLPWLLWIWYKRAGNSGASKGGIRGLIEIDLGDHKDSDDLEQEAKSESGLENIQPDPDKVATKLDLACAYIDMGDLDGAKEILDDVRSQCVTTERS